MTLVLETGAPQLCDGRRQQLAALDFDGFRVRRAAGADDLAVIAALRAESFGRVIRSQRSASAGHDGWLDTTDRHPATGLLLLEEAATGTPIASMRVQDSRHGPMELSRLVDLGALVPGREWPLLQCARLAAVRHPRRIAALFALMKAMWLRALADGVQNLILATPYWSRWMYEALQFTDLGDAAAFAHPLSGAAHRVMIFDVPSAEARLEGAGNPLAAQLFRTHHPLLDFD
jgi:hypothetical protein